MATKTLKVIYEKGSFHPVDGATVPLAEGKEAEVVWKTEEKGAATRKPFVFGLHQGMGEMSDDFDDELPDSFWLGEE